MVIAADRAPAADGLNVTAKEQLAPGAMLPMQEDALVANSAGLLVLTLEIMTIDPPVLDTDNVCAALATPTV
jgi:hypothetical protein